MKKYFLIDGEKQTGPFNLEELKNIGVTKNSMIWYEGLPEWVKANEIDEIKSLIPNISTPPPIPKEKVSQSNSNPSTTNTISVNQQKTKKSKGRFLIPIIGILLLGAGGIFIMNQNSGSGYQTTSFSTKTYKEKIVSVADVEKSNPVRFLSADGIYRENFIGDKLKVSGTITNKATVATYKDAVVRVTYYSKSKTNLGSEDYTIWDIFSPNQTKKFKLKIKNYSNVNSISWDVVKAQNYRK
jgi:hypothetical protein